MKRGTLIFINAATVASLVLCVAAAALSVRSYAVTDRWTLVRSPSTPVELVSAQGGLSVARYGPNPGGGAGGGGVRITSSTMIVPYPSWQLSRPSRPWRRWRGGDGASPVPPDCVPGAATTSTATKAASAPSAGHEPR